MRRDQIWMSGYHDVPDQDEETLEEWDLTKESCTNCGAFRWSRCNLNDLGVIVYCDLCPADKTLN